MLENLTELFYPVLASVVAAALIVHSLFKRGEPEEAQRGEAGVKQKPAKETE